MIFATDLDGTLLNANYQIDEKIEGILDSIFESNIPLVLVTGRTLHGIGSLDYFKDKPVFIVAMNGAIVLDNSQEEVAINALDKSVVDLLSSMYQNDNFEYTTQDHVYMMISKERYLQQYGQWDIWRNKLNTPEKLEYHLKQYVFNVSKEGLLKKDILKINGLEFDDKTYHEKMESINQIGTVKNAPFSKNVFEWTSKQTSKLSGLLSLCEIENWNYDEVHVFGDGGNDIEMLNFFKHSYAPENADEEVKKIVSKIVPSNHEYGVPNKMLELMNKIW